MSAQPRNQRARCGQSPAPARIVAILALLLAAGAGMCRAQYVQLWSLTSAGGPDAATFDLGDESNEVLYPAVQHGSRGGWPGGTAHSARSLARPGVNGVHGNRVLPYPAQTVYGDTDGDGQVNFVSDDVLTGMIVVHNAAGVPEAMIPYPPVATQILYMILLDVNAQDGFGSCEIVAHWWGPGNAWGTTCWGSIRNCAAPQDRLRLPADLGQNKPNPFGPRTEIRYSLPASAEMSLLVYDVDGRLVRTLQQGRQAAGDHTVVWDRRNNAGSPVAAGIYFYELSDGAQKRVRKAVVLE